MKTAATPLFTIMFTHPAYYGGQVSKDIYASSFDEAVLKANDSGYYPTEYPDYDRMNRTIINNETLEQWDYNELPE